MSNDRKGNENDSRNHYEPENINDKAIMSVPFNIENVIWDEIEDANDWIFIMASARSGSSAISHLLNDHPNIHMTDEDYGIHNLCALLSAPKQKKGHYIRPSNNLRRYRASTIRALCKTYRSCRCDAKCRYFGDKITYVNRIPFFLKLFPSAKIIVPIRHPLGIIDSLMFRGFLENVMHWDKDAMSVEQLALKLFPWYDWYSDIPNHQSEVFCFFFDELFYESTMRSLMKLMSDFLEFTPRNDHLVDIGYEYIVDPHPINRWQQNEEIPSIVDVWVNTGRISEREAEMIMLPSQEWVKRQWGTFCGKDTLRNQFRCPF